MPLIQGGPPEWMWERTPEALKWEVVTSNRPDGQTVYGLRVPCGLVILRLHFLTAEEVRQLLASLLAAHEPEHSASARPARRGGPSAQVGTGSEGGGGHEGAVVPKAAVAAWTKRTPWLPRCHTAWRGWSRPAASSSFSRPVGMGPNAWPSCL
jgi:hypothetical protein